MNTYKREHTTHLAFCLAVLVWINHAAAAGGTDAALDPRGEIHIPVGIANTLDSLKTFVEAEGSFSPGVGSYGVYFWLYDRAAGRLFAPTMKDVPCTHGLAEGGYLLPWTKWTAGGIEVRSELCHVLQDAPQGQVHVVGARVTLRNAGHEPKAAFLYTALRPLGPAGFDVRDLRVADAGGALLVEGRTALVAKQNPSGSGVVPTDTIGQFARRGTMPEERSAVSAQGNCSGALRFDVTLQPGESRTFEFVCPVLPGRRAVRHQWDGVSEWAQFDLAQPNPDTGGVLQPDAGLPYYRQLEVRRLFAEARDYWQKLVGKVELRLPDPRWSEAFAAITGHAAVAMNEGAPDVAVVNYNVFNRDGVYVANILQKAGRADRAAQAIDYFLAHPFNGRSYPEADNPGQILWIMGEHWRFTRDRVWLERIYPAAQKLAAMIRYYRTADGPHWVQMDALAFGDGVPAEKRRELKPGRCDGHNPAYTEAFDLAGIRAAAVLAKALDERVSEKRSSQGASVFHQYQSTGWQPQGRRPWGWLGLGGGRGLVRRAGHPQAALEAATQRMPASRTLSSSNEAAQYESFAAELLASYDRTYGSKLPDKYGGYCVLWPCRLYPFGAGRAHEQFRSLGPQKPESWRYFPLARAHQSLLAGNREAGWRTLELHLDQPQMQRWYAFDEGGKSGSGGWGHLRTRWNGRIAMPHGWAIAEVHLLVRDCLAYEDDAKLVLFAGVPVGWFRDRAGMKIKHLPTHFGDLAVSWDVTSDGGTLRLEGKAAPPQGFILSLPDLLKPDVSVGGKKVENSERGFILPADTKEAHIRFGS